jgi:hypothetical protein
MMNGNASGNAAQGEREGDIAEGVREAVAVETSIVRR